MDKNNNLAAIDKLLAREEIVTVAGQELILKLPSDEKIKEVRALTSKIALLNEGEDSFTEEILDAASDLSVLCIAACLGIDEDVALRVLVASGGDRSDLSEKARGLLGLSIEADDDDDDDEDGGDPTLDPS